MNGPEIKNTMSPPNVFEVKDCALIAIATGRRAINLKEMQDTLSAISLDSVYYHFWGGLLQPRFEEREFNNDFAAWAWYGLHDAPLAERLAVVDPTGSAGLEDLRQELLGIIEERLDEKDSLYYVLATARFEFIRSQIVIFDSQKRAETPEKLAEFLPTLSTGSIFITSLMPAADLINIEMILVTGCPAIVNAIKIFAASCLLLTRILALFFT